MSVQWAISEKIPAADFTWELAAAGATIDRGTAAMNNGDLPVTISMKAPAVRVRTPMRLNWRLVERGTMKMLEEGSTTVHVFPNDLAADWAGRVGERKLIVWDHPDGLPKILTAVKVPFTRVDSLNGVLDRPDLILVGRDQLDASAFGQTALMNFAKAGSSVGVFEQSKPHRLAGYVLSRRDGPADFKSRADHPLFDGFTPGDLQRWPIKSKTMPRAVQLPVDEPALEIAWWPTEVASGEPSPIDALLVTRSIGTGRVVLCQLPLEPWDQDPRSQMFLGNLLAYLGTRPEPTPPPSQRRETAPAKVVRTPTIELK